MQKGNVTHNPIVLQSCFHVFNNLKIKVNRKILMNNFLSIRSHNPPHIPSLPHTHTHVGGGGREKKERIYSSTYCSRSESHFLARKLPWQAAAVFIRATEQSYPFRHPVINRSGISVKHLQVFAEDLLCAKQYSSNWEEPI